LRIRRSPSIVLQEADRDIYLVLDDFGDRLGRAWRETEEEDTDRETLIRDLMIARPPLGGVEGYDANWTGVLAFL
jgi:hypothetical protein